jgi:hypothetical protein
LRLTKLLDPTSDFGSVVLVCQHNSLPDWIETALPIFAIVNIIHYGDLMFAVAMLIEYKPRPTCCPV